MVGCISLGYKSRDVHDRYTYLKSTDLSVSENLKKNQSWKVFVQLYFKNIKNKK